MDLTNRHREVLTQIRVRPLQGSEQARYQEQLARHHYTQAGLRTNLPWPRDWQRSQFQSRYESERSVLTLNQLLKKIWFWSVDLWSEGGAVDNGFIVIHGKLPGSPTGELSTYP